MQVDDISMKDNIFCEGITENLMVWTCANVVTGISELK